MKTRIAVVCLIAVAAALKTGAATSTRLFEILSERYILDKSGQTILDLGRLTADGEFKHSIYYQLTPGTVVPDAAMNRNLLPLAVFPAYDVLGADALSNFKVDGMVTVGTQNYFVMSVVAQPKLDVGNVVNLSARAPITSNGDPLIGGFVITDHPRRVLVRGIGPTLANFGVSAPLANPTITVFRAGEQTGFATSAEWGQQANADEIASATESVGAFSLARTSKDAALLIELPPGSYTVQLHGIDGQTGTALLEIYTLP